MRNVFNLTTVFLLLILINSCNQNQKLRREISILKNEWKYEFPLPSNNDSINLLALQMEISYFTFEFKKTDSLARKILSMDSTFYGALAFLAFSKWPFDMEMLKKAKKYASKDTSIHGLIFEGDYNYWINHDTITALKQYTEVYKRYSNSKIAAWLAGMASLWSKDYSMAIKYYNRALEIDSTFYHSYNDLGDTYFESKQYKKAIENYSKFLKYYPSKYRIYAVIGDSYKAMDDTVNANKQYKIADSIEIKLKNNISFKPD